jgi:hypothetical protein
VTINIQGKMCQINNSVSFSRQPIGSEESLNQMVKALGITIDRVLTQDPVKGKIKS